jgi:hypothetical protein
MQISSGSSDSLSDKLRIADQQSEMNLEILMNSKNDNKLIEDVSTAEIPATPFLDIIGTNPDAIIV